MKFINWLEEIVDKEMGEKTKKDLQKSGGLLSEKHDDRLIQLYLAYQTYLLVRKTHWLAIATWALAIGTILVLIFK